MYSCLFLMDANHATRVRMRLMIHMTMTTGKQALSKVNSGSSTLWGRKMPIYVMAAHQTRVNWQIHSEKIPSRKTFCNL